MTAHFHFDCQAVKKGEVILIQEKKSITKIMDGVADQITLYLALPALETFQNMTDFSFPPPLPD
jgi:hypothetical protein